jgi:hypothetical protein
MKNPVQLTKAINPVRDSPYRSPLRRGLPRVQPIWIIRGFLLITLVLGSFALSRTAEAALDPSDTAYGTGALSSEAGGTHNSAFGFDALNHNTTGLYNTATGAFALYNNTTNTSSGQSGANNTATGASALQGNTTGTANTASGLNALYSNSTGWDNTASGVGALYYNTIGNRNTATGASALQGNTTGTANTATGKNALYYNKTGYSNTANGYQALYHSTGINNIGLGYNAGFNLTNGSGNVYIGAGVLGVLTESNTTRIRNVYSSVASGRVVYVNSDNKIGTVMSSRRFKDEIKPMDKASEAILALKPVTFRYKKEIEPNSAIMFGLIAEEVEQVDPSLVTRNDKGEVETVRYDAVNAMLLNEFLKEHRKLEDLKKDFQATIAQQRKQIEALTSGLEKVSAQLEVSRSAPRTVLNNQ